MNTPRLALALTLTCVAGCSGSSSDTTPNDDAGTTADQLSFDTSTYTLKPGEENRYMCFTSRLPKDAETIVNEITPIYGKATHHLGIYYTLSPEPEGVFACPELVRENWVPLYGGGIESGTLKLPDNAGFHLLKNAQILVQLHLLNAGTETITDKATIVLKTTKNKDVVQAGVFGFDNRDLHIPAHSTGAVETMDCPNVERDMDVFAVFGHMHQNGKTLDMSRGPKLGDEMLHEEKWSFDDQPTTPKSFRINKGDDLHLRCTYDNPSDKELNYGESSYNEMCSFVFYYTPYKALDGCVKSPPTP